VSKRGPQRKRALRRRGQRGAVLVEAAFVLPILALMIFGILEWGFVLKDYQSLASATRSGARTASAEPRLAGFDTDAANAVATAMKALQGNDTPQKLEIYWADSGTGLPWSSNAKSSDEALPTSTCYRCSYYTWNAATAGWTAVTQTWPASGSATAENACAGTEDTMGVFLQVSHRMFTGMFGATKTLTDRTLIKLEPQPPTSGTCSG
jgi:Flp pilus assembly protein TadG